MYQMKPKGTKGNQNAPNGYKISQISVKYINIFQSKALQNLPISKLRW
jgi:hypothetical protein